MHKRWYVGLISLGLALNALVFGRLLRRRLQSRAVQPPADRALPQPETPTPHPDRTIARPDLPKASSAPAANPTTAASIAASRQLSESNLLPRVAIGILLIAAILLAVHA